MAKAHSIFAISQLQIGNEQANHHQEKSISVSTESEQYKMWGINIGKKNLWGLVLFLGIYLWGLNYFTIFATENL